MTISPRTLGVCIGGFIATWALCSMGRGPHLSAAKHGPKTEPAPELAVDSASLTGLWRAVPGQGARLDSRRFWYFHGDGKGLYRYGTTALNNTHSFDYRAVAGGLELYFRKTGETVVVQTRFEHTPSGPSLSLDPDPEDPGANYRLERGPVARGGAPVKVLASERIDGRIWMDLHPFATGGMGFNMYQLNDAAIDGRGVGWFHRGDFDEWSTEALSFRLRGDTLTLHFSARDEHGVVEVSVAKDDKGRVLTVRDDPRDFHKDHSYRDVGESFGAFGGLDTTLQTVTWRP